MNESPAPPERIVSICVRCRVIESVRSVSPDAGEVARRAAEKIYNDLADLFAMPVDESVTTDSIAAIITTELANVGTPDADDKEK